MPGAKIGPNSYHEMQQAQAHSTDLSQENFTARFRGGKTLSSDDINKTPWQFRDTMGIRRRLLPGETRLVPSRKHGFKWRTYLGHDNEGNIVYSNPLKDGEAKAINIFEKDQGGSEHVYNIEKGKNEYRKLMKEENFVYHERDAQARGIFDSVSQRFSDLFDTGHFGQEGNYSSQGGSSLGMNGMLGSGSGKKGVAKMLGIGLACNLGGFAIGTLFCGLGSLGGLALFGGFSALAGGL